MEFSRLQLLGSKDYPVVMMDQQMPEMDGLTTIRTIRQASKPELQPYIIALTADVRIEIHQLLREAGAQITLAKPVTKETLARALEQAFSQPSRMTKPPSLDSVPEEAVNARQLFDLFESLGSGSVELHIQALDLFLQNTPPLLEKIKQHGAHFNSDGITGNLHALKSNCELYGASRLANLCKVLEHELRKGQPVELSARIQEIEKEFNVVQVFLRSVHSQKESLAGSERGQKIQKAVAIP